MEDRIPSTPPFQRVRPDERPSHGIPGCASHYADPLSKSARRFAGKDCKYRIHGWSHRYPVRCQCPDAQELGYPVRVIESGPNKSKFACFAWTPGDCAFWEENF
ncbi:hypothetical protein GF362_06445 [Candidatus Dojkabacteria bacterium]|nr:hypothetical protein [Candidatus Dojkabacteria bacterium]